MTFPDPQNFVDESAFTYAAKVTSIYKKVIAEILGEVDKRIDESKYYVKKESGELLDKFEIGKDDDSQNIK